ncbi:chemotaxis protein CheB [Hymenobacter tibetensis]|uniref:protein-glutamate methylesterase n=1 Tax=Hymenobacter tibetensis TaxID=497967 RepID=A0ABY4CTG7_9BACT|nr:chemotaxis protein CheB [Hymenobacter tibetensis]UOG73327.1 chemotaxis protein CheB [Hymenobacter tibetensis]
MPALPSPKKGRHHRDIVVIGTSAGGVTALLALAKTLPADFPAPIFVVLHVAPDSPSIMPELLNSVSALEAKHPQNGETVRAGVIYLAPPDHHLLLEDDRVLVARGPKENRFRPSIDALFRSAAYTYGPRVLGVVLTGYLDDGTSGLWSVQRMGGLAIVQDPQDAEQPAMPTNALAFVTADHLVPLSRLGSLLVRLTQEPTPAKIRLPAAELDLLKIELTIAKEGGGFELGIIEKGKLTAFTCPDCHGALTQLIEGKVIRYRCHTGHAYTVSSLLSEVTESVESMLYQSMRGLEETKMLLDQLGTHFQDEKQANVAQLFFEKADEVGLQARLMHESIQKQEALSGDLQFYSTKLE